MNRRQSGFTITEIVTVIVVIGILATIVVTLFARTGSSARDKTRENDTRMWAGVFDIYKGRYGVYPALPTDDAHPAYLCLGSFSSTSSKCGQYTNSTASRYIDATASPTTSMLNTITQTGNKPTNNGTAVANKVIGPLAWTSQTTNGSTGVVTVTTNFINFFELACPSDFTDISGTSDTTLAAVFNGLSGTIKICSLVKTYTYTPGS